MQESVQSGGPVELSAQPAPQVVSSSISNDVPPASQQQPVTNPAPYTTPRAETFPSDDRPQSTEYPFSPLDVQAPPRFDSTSPRDRPPLSPVEESDSLRHSNSLSSSRDYNPPSGHPGFYDRNQLPSQQPVAPPFHSQQPPHPPQQERTAYGYGPPSAPASGAMSGGPHNPPEKASAIQNMKTAAAGIHVSVSRAFPTKPR